MNTVSRVWSDKQQAIFAEVAQGAGNLIVTAVPGSGKTTTIVEAMKHVPQGKTVLAVAFNKAIAVEMGQKVPAGVVVSTLHAHGMKAVTRAWGRVRVDGDKGRDIARRIANENFQRVYNDGGDREAELREWALSLVKCVSLSKSYLASSSEAIQDVIDSHQIVPSENDDDRPEFIRQVKLALEACKTSKSSIDFDDMIWLPAVLGLAVPQFDMVFVDETQDLTAGQIALVLKSVKKSGRIVAVGDPRQSIYQFAGSGSDSIEQVKKALGAKTLPLSITYRCSKAVVNEARRISTQIEAAPDADMGSLLITDEMAMLKGAREGDFVLSRTNAQLLGLCLGFLKGGKRANIQGRDIGTKLTAVIRRSKCKDVDSMLAYVHKWTDKEILRLEQRDRDATGVSDTRDCIVTLSEGEEMVDSVIAKIEELFADGDSQARITLSTTHKAKGLERDRVWILRDTYMKTRKGQTGVSIEEENLYYVAVTRAKRDLFLVKEAK
jgi:DNA helicase II / ATP-dependent DNA helicase PcrA